jgi:hypothetical protein
MILIAAGLIPLIAISTFLIYQSYSVESVQTTTVALEVGSIYGFDVDSSILQLGQIPPGGAAYRNLTVFNDQDRERNIRIILDQPLREWAQISHERFTLPPYGNQTVMVTLRPPGDTPRDNYTSTLYVQYLK